MRSQKTLVKLKKASEEANKGNYLKSISLCKEVINKEKKSPPAYKLLATNLIQLNRYSEVEATLKKVIKLVDKEESFSLVHLLGCNYISQGRYSEALDILENLFNETGNSKVLLDIGLAYYKSDMYKEAREVYLKLIELEPNNHDAKRNIFPIFLRFKEFKSAWTCFHSRLELPEVKDKIHWFAPKWSGESLVGKNILIFPEQGIGDNLDYSGCFAEAISDAKNTYIICDDRLQALYEYNFPTAKIIPASDVNRDQAINADLDLQIIAGSLSYLYRLSEESFINQANLSISDKFVEPINKRLSKNKLRIGISWFHGRVNDGNEFSMYLEELLPVLKIEGIEWVSLQFGESHKEIENIQKKYGIQITHFEECSAAGDFNHYGSLIANLDLVISASNAALMFASRLGVRTWMFLPGKQIGFKQDSNQYSLVVKKTRVFYKAGLTNWGSAIQQFYDEINAFPGLKTKKNSYE